MFWDEPAIDALLQKYPDIHGMYKQEQTMYGKADIARIVILYEHGGVYIDADSVWLGGDHCMNTLAEETITEGCDFYAAYEPGRTHPANGVMGSVQRGDTVKALLDALHKMSSKYIELRRMLEPWELTGPILLETTRSGGASMKVFPAKLFYPRIWHGIKDPLLHTKIELPEESYMFQYGISTNRLENY